MDEVSPEFASPNRNGDVETSFRVAQAFSKLLEEVKACVAPSRELSLVVMKLQEAHFFAQIAPRKEG